MYSSPAGLPVAGIICNLRIGPPPHRQHATGERNATAMLDVAGALPLLIPALGDRIDPVSLFSVVDGILLTGGASNIEPHWYGQEPAPGEDERDPGRDSLALTLVRTAVRHGVPLLGTCRGIQEMNVAFGGTLHQRLHEVPGRLDHRRNRELPIEQSVRPRQRVALARGGILASLLGEEQALVNSLHGQGIDRLAPELEAEATAEDGTVEAVRVRSARSFAVGVQWHVEIGATDDPLNRAILEEFGRALRRRAAERMAERYTAEAAE